MGPFAPSKYLSVLVVSLSLIVQGCDQAAEEAVKSAPGEAGSSQTTQAPAGSASPKKVPSAWPKAAREFLADWTKREGAFRRAYDATFKSEIGQRKAFVKLSRQVYEGRELTGIFTDGLDLNAAGRAMLATVDLVHTHGLDPKAYHRVQVHELVTEVERTRGVFEEVWKAPEAGQVRTIWHMMKALKNRDPNRLVPQDIEAEVRKAGLAEVDVKLLPRVDALLGKIFEAKAALNEACIRLDLEMLSTFFRFAYDMRFAKIAHPFDADKKYWDGVKRHKDALYDLSLVTDFSKLKGELETWAPQIPEYAKMQTGLAFYEGLAAGPPQMKLPRKAERLKLGNSGELVKKLQERLSQEGYYSGDVTGAYDEATAGAVSLYQETHQLKNTGNMARVARRSMNRSFATRARQIRLGLMRHRESDLHQGQWRFGSVPVQARVNIPGFEAKFFKDGKLARTHRVIVGNDRLSVDERSGRKGWFNRTRLFSKEMVTVVLNPTWRVPRRIKEQELDRELLEHPDYYETHGYEVRILDDGSEQVVQLSGPGNALGQVKFLFPNRFSIYMHDTPKKSLFKRHIRAFSHGCMRLQDPIDLARWILVDIEGRSERWLKKVLASREVYGLPLKTKIPVTIEYNTVGVHSSGRMMFFLDVYRFDRDYLAGNTPYPRLSGRSLDQAVVVSDSKGPKP